MSRPSQSVRTTSLKSCSNTSLNSLKEKFNGQIPKIDLFQADLTDRSSIDKIFAAYEDKGKIWGVIHLAVSSWAVKPSRKLADGFERRHGKLSESPTSCLFNTTRTTSRVPSTYCT